MCCLRACCARTEVAGRIETQGPLRQRARCVLLKCEGVCVFACNTTSGSLCRLAWNSVPKQCAVSHGDLSQIPVQVYLQLDIQ